MIDSDHAEEYTQALGQVAAGAWRQIALGERMGVPEALGLTTREWVEERLGGYVRLRTPDRREAVAELVAEGMTTNQVSDVFGVHKATVNRDRSALASRESDPSANGAEPQEASDADAPPSLEDRIARLDKDLAGRVRDGLDIDEAESVAVERRKRTAAWVTKVREALTVLSRMVGSPVPRDLSKALTKPERDALKAALEVIPKGVGE